MEGRIIAYAAAAAIAKAAKVSGAIVNMEPDDFAAIAHRCEKPLIVAATGGFINKSYQYLVGYKSLVFHTKSSNELTLPGKSEVVHATNIWIPG